MAGKIGIFQNLQKVRKISSIQRTFTAGKVIYNKPSSSTVKSSDTITESNVPGLSPNVVSLASEAVGPGASKSSNYKNPEYFCYSNMSYFEAEVEMLKYRCPQPSNKK